MKNNTESIKAKKERLAKRLLELKEKWPYSERSMWCYTNGCNTEAINRNYLRGHICSIPIAEKLIEAIENHIKNEIPA